MKSTAAFLILIFAAAPSFAADDKKSKIDADVKKATDKAYEWLASKQNTDGSWGDAQFGYPNSTAITGFALMAFLSQGNLPTEGKYAKEVAKGVRFLIAAQQDNGFIVGARGGKMYDHGMATLALSQVWAMTGDEDVKACLKKAVNLIVKCQCKDKGDNHGGWRYDPAPSGADISVTIMQVMALRGAKDSGIHVPDDTMTRALSYINSCYDDTTGGYKYMPRQPGPGFARTAAGICVVKLTGQYDKDIDKSVRYLKTTMEIPQQHFWYGHYYACHAMHQVGGKDWDDYYKFIKKKFLDMQSADGSWSRPALPPGAVYQTAIAVIALSVPANYLPIFQR